MTCRNLVEISYMKIHIESVKLYNILFGSIFCITFLGWSLNDTIINAIEYPYQMVKKCLSKQQASKKEDTQEKT